MSPWRYCTVDSVIAGAFGAGTLPALRVPEGNDEAACDDERSTCNDRQVRAHTEEHRIDDLRDDKEQRHIDAEQLAEVLGQRIDGQALGKQHYASGNEQPDA